MWRRALGPTCLSYPKIAIWKQSLGPVIPSYWILIANWDPSRRNSRTSRNFVPAYLKWYLFPGPLCPALLTYAPQTAQQVELQMENNNKAVLVFTIVTIIFLPLSVVTSFFGMNVSDIRDMKQGQSLFWAIGLGFTAVVVLVAVLVAFFGARLWTAVARRTGLLPDVEKGKFD